MNDNQNPDQENMIDMETAIKREVQALADIQMRILAQRPMVIVFNSLFVALKTAASTLNENDRTFVGDTLKSIAEEIINSQPEITENQQLSLVQ